MLDINPKEEKKVEIEIEKEDDTNFDIPQSVVINWGLEVKEFEEWDEYLFWRVKGWEWQEIVSVEEIRGYKGTDWVDGIDWLDWYTPMKWVDYFDWVDWKDGKNGKDWKDWKDWINGVDAYDMFLKEWGQDIGRQQFSEILRRNIEANWTIIWGNNWVQSITAWSNITVDNTDPRNPIISSTGWSWSWDVTWPASAVDNNFASFDTTTWKLIQDSWYNSTSFAPALWSDDNYVTDAQLAIIAATTASFTTADEIKLYNITVTQPVDLDQMETDIAALANGMVYKGNWDASVWTFPWAWAAQTGRFYTVSVGWTVDSVVFNVWDRLVAIVDNTSATTYTSNWTLLDATDAVTSIFGRTWNVVATGGDYNTSQVTENTNLYFTDERAQDAVWSILVDSSEIEFSYNDATPSITASIVSWSIDESKLDVSVNASLDLADNALPSSYLDTDWTLSANSDTKVPSQKAVRTAINNAVTWLLDYRGTYDASSNLYPSTWGSWLVWVVAKWDFWMVSTPWTLWWTAVTNGDLIIALVDTPWQTSSNWDIVSNEIWYTPENVANKATTMTGNTASNTLYLTAKAIYDRATATFANIAWSVSQVFSASSIELWHASDTTLSRSSPGVIAVEGVVIPSVSSQSTMTNKRNQPRIVSAASYTTDTGTSLGFSTCDLFIVTAQAGALKFNNPSGTPQQWESIIIRVKDNGTARALTYDTQYRAIGITLPTTTVVGKTTYIGGIWNATDSKIDCLATATEA